MKNIPSHILYKKMWAYREEGGKCIRCGCHGFNGLGVSKTKRHPPPRASLRTAPNRWNRMKNSSSPPNRIVLRNYVKWSRESASCRLIPRIWHFNNVANGMHTALFSQAFCQSDCRGRTFIQHWSRFPNRDAMLQIGFLDTEAWSSRDQPNPKCLLSISVPLNKVSVKAGRLIVL